MNEARRWKKVICLVQHFVTDEIMMCFDGTKCVYICHLDDQPKVYPLRKFITLARDSISLSFFLSHSLFPEKTNMENLNSQLDQVCYFCAVLVFILHIQIQNHKKTKASSRSEAKKTVRISIVLNRREKNRVCERKKNQLHHRFICCT